MGTPSARIDELKEHLLKAENRRKTFQRSVQKWERMYSKRPKSGVTRDGFKGDEMNLAFPEVETFVGMATGYMPRLSFTPRKLESQFTAFIAESVCDYWFERQRVDQKWIDATRNVGISGMGWMKVTWNKNSQRADRVVKTTKKDLDSVKGLRDEVAMILGGAPSDEAIIRYLNDKAKQIRIGEPVVTSIHPLDMLWDPYCTSLSMGNPRWKAHQYWRSVRSVREDTDLLTSARNKVEATSLGTTKDANLWGMDGLGDDPLQRVLFTELWDAERQQLLIFADGIETPLFDEEWPYVTGDPFIYVPGHEIPKSPYPMGVIELIGDQVNGTNEQRRITHAIRKGQIPKNIVNKRLLTDAVREVLKSEIPNDTAVADTNEPLGNLIYRLQGEPMSPDWFNADAMFKSDADYVLGFGNIARGNTLDSSHHSAAEVSGAITGSGQRNAAIVNNIRYSVIDVGRKMIGHAGQFMSGTDVVKVTGFAKMMAEHQRYAAAGANVDVPAIMETLKEQGAFFTPEGDMMFPFTGQHVDGEFDLSIQVGPQIPEDASVRSQRALQMFQTLAGAAQYVNMPKLVEYVMDQGFNVKNAQDFAAEPPAMPQETPGQGSVPGVPAQAPGAASAPGLTPFG